MVMDLNEAFARELQGVLRRDPEMADEVFESRSILKRWIKDQVEQQTWSDDLSPAVARFIKQHLKTEEVMRWF